MIVAASILLILVAAIGVPYLFVKHLGIGITRRARAARATIGLTFDDGPDPETTPRVLDLLWQHGVKATFFVEGTAAERHPGLVRRALAEGHDVASHGFRHRHALFQRWPLEGYFDTVAGVRRLERLIGRRVDFFRPPWGAYSWGVLIAARRCGVRTVNWSIESHDWHPRFEAPDVVRKVLEEAESGAIIVMHDAGRGGPKTVHALGAVLAGLTARGLSPVPLSRMAFGGSR